MTGPRKILVLQTAFVGDVVLALPLVQVLRKLYPSSPVDFLAAPRASGLLENHPDVRKVHVFDKRGVDSGLLGIMSMARRIKHEKYDVVFVPHRSFRSALLARLSGISRRIGFDKSAGRYLFTSLITYDASVHEIERDLKLITALGVAWCGRELPSLYPDEEDRAQVRRFLVEHEVSDSDRLIAIAPGSVWNTKRWPKDRFVQLIQLFIHDDYEVVLVGGEADAGLCADIVRSVRMKEVYDAAGKMSLLQSAELIHRSKLLVTNDTAPMHMAVAVRTPVVAIFGPTVPSFGFTPYGDHDRVVETKGLSCRPCSIHGSAKCPIGTFECMLDIEARDVYSQAQGAIQEPAVNARRMT